ncbi:MAG: hypothetical protein IME96_11755 [Proteobacteria bacterium]|nr:hypothetical protein [Pseudomonadota bacterium]
MMTMPDKRLLTPRTSLYLLFTFFLILIFNQLFLGAPLITIFVVFLLIIPFYRLFTEESGHGAVLTIETNGDGLEQKYQELEACLSQGKRLVADFQEKAALMVLSAEAQADSLGKTTASLDGINETIDKTVNRVDDLFSLTDRASISTHGVVNSINEVSTHNKNMLEVVAKSLTDVKILSNSVMKIKNNFTDLSEASKKGATAIQQVNVFAKEIEENALKSHEMSEDVSRESELGVSAVIKTIESMDKIKKIVSESSSVIKTLGEKSGEIGSVIGIINNITKRINLLSLNASIIASQAGEHGKAFAVVADEMEKLASQTSLSTVEISELIKMTQEMVTNTVQSNEVGMWGVEEGVTLANQAGDILNKIQASAGASLSMSKMILMSTKHQSEMVEKVFEAIFEEGRYFDTASNSINGHMEISESVEKSTEEVVHISSSVRKDIDRQLIASEDVLEVIKTVTDTVKDLEKLTKQQIIDGERIKQATEMMTFITNENVTKDLTLEVERIRAVINSMEEIVFPQASTTAG